MICFEVEVNREHVCTAGVGEFGLLTSGLSWRRRHQPSPMAGREERGVVLSVGGFTEAAPGAGEVVEWAERCLEVGDEVTVRVVNAARGDDPAERKPRVKKSCQGAGCSFCGKRLSEVGRMIGSEGGAHICGECVEGLSLAIAEGRRPSTDGSAA